MFVLRSVFMLEQEVGVEGPVVVVVVTARAGAGVELHALVRGTVVSNVGMTMEANVLGLSQAVFQRDLRLVFRVAGNALHGVDLLKTVSVSRVGKLGARVRVERLHAYIAVAFDTGVL